jgi:hypothetical protein
MGWGKRIICGASPEEKTQPTSSLCWVLLTRHLTYDIVGFSSSPRLQEICDRT